MKRTILIISIISVLSFLEGYTQERLKINLIAIGFEGNAYRMIDGDILYDPGEMFVDMEIINISDDIILFGANNLSYFSQDSLRYGFFTFSIDHEDSVVLYSSSDVFQEIPPRDTLFIMLRHEDRKDRGVSLKKFRAFNTEKSKEEIKTLLERCEIVYTPLPKDYENPKERYFIPQEPIKVSKDNFNLSYAGHLSVPDTIWFTFDVGDDFD